MSKFICLSLIFISMIFGKVIYNHSKSYIIRLSDFNFDDQIKKYRQKTKYVNYVHFYKSSGKLL